MQQKSVYISLGIVVVILAGTLGFLLIPVEAPVSKIPVCTSEAEGMPVLTHLSKSSGPVGTSFTIHGCNLNGFEGDLNAWIVNEKGVKGIIYGDFKTSTFEAINVTVPEQLCQKDNSYTGDTCTEFLNLTPGTYRVYVYPWGKKSNELNFTVTQ